VSTLKPRAVLVTRESDVARLAAAHATVAQAAFFLKTRGPTIAEVTKRAEVQVSALEVVRAAIPDDWRLVRVGRAELDRFIFSPEDVVIAVGQDGLVANLAKYLTGQPVLGVNPDPALNEGVLVPLKPGEAAKLVVAAAEGSASLERRVMAEARTDDGQVLQALNEVFVGHRSHQSARYVITVGGTSEKHSSSGVIVSTGTGSTGWARSIMTSTGHPLSIAPTEQTLAYFVREPWPSVATGASIAWGALRAGEPLTILSNMNDGGVIFADGMEQDHLDFGWGRTVSIGVAQKTLNLVRA
jgi:NAD kinase